MRFLVYLGRWQLSTPILAGVCWALPWGYWAEAVAANLVGGCLFYAVDKRIFSKWGRNHEQRNCTSNSRRQSHP